MYLFYILKFCMFQMLCCNPDKMDAYEFLLCDTIASVESC